jgi:hypothetical protein
LDDGFVFSTIHASDYVGCFWRAWLYLAMQLAGYGYYGTAYENVL